MMTLGQHLERVRKRKGLSLRSVAEQSRALHPRSKQGWVSHTYLRKLEADSYRSPSPTKIEALATVYGIEYRVLLKRAGYLSKKDTLSVGRGDDAAVDSARQLREHLDRCGINPDYFTRALLRLGSKSLLLVHRLVTMMAIREREAGKKEAEKTR
jgi:transcriptional regulator with XRE-family HTH domain